MPYGLFPDVPYGLFLSIVSLRVPYHMPILAHTQISNMAALVADTNSLASRYRTKSHLVGDVLRYMGAPKETRNRVADYYDFLATHDHPGGYNKVSACSVRSVQLPSRYVLCSYHAYLVEPVVDTGFLRVGALVG